MLHPYVGLRAEDTVDTVLLKDGLRRSPFRYVGRVVAVAEEHQRVGEVSHGGLYAVLLLEDGTHASVPLDRVRAHGGDIPEARRRLASLGIAFADALAPPTTEQLDQLRERSDG